MDLLALIRILFHRWYVFVPTLALAGAGALVIVTAVPPQFQAASQVLLLAPKEPSSTIPDSPGLNPYLNFSSSLGAVADLTAKAMNDIPTARRLKAQGVTGTYTVTVDQGASPTVTIVDKSPNAGAVLPSLNLLVSEFSAEVTQRQRASGAPPGQLIEVTRLTTPDRAERLGSGKLRAGAALAILGLTFSLLCTALFDSLARSRQADRQARGVEPGADGVGESLYRLPQVGPS